VANAAGVAGSGFAEVRSMARPLFVLLCIVALVLVSSVGEAVKPPGGGGGPSPPVPPVYTPTGPAAPYAFTIDRDVSAEPDGVCVGQPHDVCARWINASPASSASLQRSSTPNGPWAQVAFRNAPMAANTVTQLFDFNPPVDAFVCYRVVLTDSWGSTPTPANCVFTRDGEERSVWRARVRMRTSTQSGSSSDAAVQVRLQGPIGLNLAAPTGNETWIDTPIDDFAGGSDVWYELSTKGLGDVSDVTQLTIDVEGNDNLCLREVELELNGEQAFLLDNGAGPCTNVTDAANLFITHAQLRASPEWQSMEAPERPAAMEYEWLDALVTSTVGDAIHGYDVQFMEPTIDIANPSVENLDSHTRRYVYAFWYESIFPLTVTFDLVTSTVCDDGIRMGVISVENIDADVDGWLYVFYPIAEIIIEEQEPSWPYIQVEGELIGCEVEIDLCFGASDLAADFCS
jgi:hypothetical protein